MPLYSFRERVRAYLIGHYTYLALVGLLFCMGIIFGALTVNKLAPNERNNLQEYLQSFLHDFNGSIPLAGSDLAREAIWNNLRTVAFLFVLGVTAVLTPFILLVVFTRGFVLGFTIGFLVKQSFARGFFFALGAVVPHNLLLVPALLLAAAANIDFGVSLVKSRLSRKPVALGSEFLHCLGLTGISIAVLVIAGLVEGYISPALMALMAKQLP